MGLVLHTRNLTAGQSMVLDGTEGVIYISYVMSSGTSDAGTVTGTVSFKASSDPSPVASSAVALGPGQGNVFLSEPTKPLAYSFGCVTGTLKVIIGF